MGYCPYLHADEKEADTSWRLTSLRQRYIRGSPRFICPSIQPRPRLLNLDLRVGFRQYKLRSLLPIEALRFWLTVVHVRQYPCNSHFLP